MKSSSSSTTLFRVRVPKKRLKNAEMILSRLGLKPGEAFNMFLAQVELREGLPFEVTTKPLLSAQRQAEEWTKSFGEY